MKNELEIGAGCGRKEDLIGYLYGESSPGEIASFEEHLAGCASCSDELLAFGRVRDDLGAWQVGFAPQTAFEPPRRKWDVLVELVGMFPIWARGAALVATALALFAVTFGASQLIRRPTEARLSHAEIEALVRDAVAKERVRLETGFKTELAGLRDEMNADQEERIRQLREEHDQKIKTLEAGFRSEIRKANRQNSSIRSFFAMDDSPDPWGGTR